MQFKNGCGTEITIRAKDEDFLTLEDYLDEDIEDTLEHFQISARYHLTAWLSNAQNLPAITVVHPLNQPSSAAALPRDSPWLPEKFILRAAKSARVLHVMVKTAGSENDIGDIGNPTSELLALPPDRSCGILISNAHFLRKILLPAIAKAESGARNSTDPKAVMETVQEKDNDGKETEKSVRYISFSHMDYVSCWLEKHIFARSWPVANLDATPYKLYWENNAAKINFSVKGSGATDRDFIVEVNKVSKADFSETKYLELTNRRPSTRSSR